MKAIVYRFYDRTDNPLYIGITVAGPRRWGEHMLTQPWWPTVATIKVQHCDSIAEAAFIEAQAIKEEQPVYNVTHKRSRGTRLLDQRRPNGNGSVFQRRSDGRWVATVSRGPRGQRQTSTKYCRTRLEAERALVELLAVP